MICNHCRQENPENAKFCIECGSKLELTCPGCTTICPPGSKFCPECGTRLSDRSKSVDLSPLEEKIDKIQHYLPEGITDKILSQKDWIEREKKQLNP